GHQGARRVGFLCLYALLFSLLIAVPNPVSGQASLDWANLYAGGDRMTVWDLVLDQQNAIYAVGSFQDTMDADIGPATFNLISEGSADIFILKLDTSGALIWAKRIGAAGVDVAFSIVADTFGHIYVGGYFENTVDFDPGVGVQSATSNGGRDVFIMKMDSAGDFEWLYTAGGAQFDVVSDLHLDDFGGLEATGGFQNTVTFDPLGGSVLVGTGIREAFFLKLDTSGSFDWARSIGSSGFDQGYGIYSDPAGDLYVTGSFSSTVDFDPGPATVSLTSNGSTDIYIAKYNAQGTFVWVKQVGGSAGDSPADLDLDQSGHIVVCGHFHNTVDFDPGAGVHNETSVGQRDGFVLKLDSAGLFEWVYTIGALADEIVNDITIDAQNNIYSTGQLQGTADFDPGPGVLNLSSSTNGGCFGQMVDSMGNLVWAANTGSLITVSYSYSICPVGPQMVFLCGTYTGSADFDPGASTLSATSQGLFDGFVTRWQPLVVPCTTVTNTVSQTSCDSLLSPSGNAVWTASGVYQDTLTAQSGCDSVITVNLMIIGPQFSTAAVTTCDSLLSPSGNVVWTASGVYQDTLTAQSGCDSIITVNLTIDSTQFSAATITTCDSLLSPSGNVVWTASGVYHDTLTAQSGCDSVVTVNLTIDSTQFSTVAITACDSLVSPSGNFVWTTSGVYQDTLSASSGCDSILTVNLTINTTRFDTANLIACGSQLSPSGTVVWTASGVYNDTLVTQSGCDSVVTVNLTIDSVLFDSITIVTCDSLLAPSGSVVWTASGVYRDTLSASGGCDSILTINLTVNATQFDTTTIITCDSLLSPSGNFVWRASGTYHDTLVAQSGCDSVINVDLTIQNPSEAPCDSVECEIRIPNVFTPNSDGINDLFEIHNTCDSRVGVLTIFNRYGQVVLKESGRYVSWSGSVSGHNPQSGTYFYLFVIGDKTLTGHITSLAD
ncbi:MAG: gliding motility-associated C-terminal domain-containing protein, partial [Bacteroidota bacterium]